MRDDREPIYSPGRHPSSGGLVLKLGLVAAVVAALAVAAWRTSDPPPPPEVEEQLDRVLRDADEVASLTASGIPTDPARLARADSLAHVVGWERAEEHRPLHAAAMLDRAERALAAGDTAAAGAALRSLPGDGALTPAQRAKRDHLAAGLPGGAGMLPPAHESGRGE